MEILKGIEIIGKALWLKEPKILVIADLHIGYEEALNKQGILVPRTQFKETEKEIKELLREIKERYHSFPNQIIINGDLKHEFGEISSQEWSDTLKIIDLLQSYCRKIVLIKGNHDTILGPIARKRGLSVVEKYVVGEIMVIHGDKVKDSALPIKTLIMGHEHPAISLHEGVKTEKYKCFLLGKFGKQQLIVMPSFLPIIEGTDMAKEKRLSPYLSGDIGNFEIFAVGDKTYRFGKLKDIKPKKPLGF